MTAYMRYLEFHDGLLASRTWTRDLDEVARVDIGELGRVLRLADLSVRTRARELDLRPGAVLEIVEVLTAATDKGTVLRDGDVDAEDDTVLEVRGDPLELHLELRDELGLTAEADLVTKLALAGAAHNAA